MQTKERSMKASPYLEYRVRLSRDKATGLVVAEVPALGIADDGADKHEALANIRRMVSFHLECLAQEGEPFPTEKGHGEGIYLRVKCPARAA